MRSKGSQGISKDKGKTGDKDCLWRDLSLATTSEHICCCNAAYELLNANPACARFWGQSKEDILGRSLPQLMGEEQFCRLLKDAFDRCLKGEAQEFEQRFDLPGKGIKHLEITLQPCPSRDGEDFEVLILFRDITECCKTKEELGRIHNCLRQVGELADIGYFERNWATGKGYWSPSFHRLLGLEPGEIPCTHTDFMRFVHEQNRERVSQHIANCLKTGQRMNIQFRIISKSGRLKYIHGIADTTLDSDGKSQITRGIFQDISSLKMAELQTLRALEDSQAKGEKLSALLDAARAVIDSDAFGATAKCIFDSCAKLIGATAGYLSLVSEDGGGEELVFLESRKNLRECDNCISMPVRGLGEVACRTNDAVLENDFKNSRWMSFVPEGEVCPGNILLAPLVIESRTLGLLGLVDKPTGFTREDAVIAKLFADMAAIGLRNFRSMESLARSERMHREARQAAEAANRTKGEFLSSISHELRTPLNGVLGMLQILEETALDNEQAEYVNIAKISSKKLAQHIQGIINLLQLEKNSLVLKRNSVNLDKIIDSIVEIFSPEAQEKGVGFIVNSEDFSGDKLIGDEELISHILFNIIGNALKFTEKGSVRLHIYPLSRHNGQMHVCFSVRDTGIGIPEENFDSIFKSFTQVDATLTRKYGGLGIGLSLVYKIALLLEATINIESTVGQGTLFEFACAFELVESHVVPETEVRKKVLIVEDDDVNQLTLKLMVEKIGFQADCVDNGQKALEILNGGGYDLALMDIQMPYMDGVSAVKALRAGSDYNKPSDIPVVAVTAHAMEGDKDRMMAAGMDGYISKPVDFNELKKTMITVIEGGHSA